MLSSQSTHYSTPPRQELQGKHLVACISFPIAIARPHEDRYRFRTKRLDEHLEKWHSRLNRLTKAGALAVAVLTIAGGFVGTILAQAGTRFLDWAAAVITAWWAG